MAKYEYPLDNEWKAARERLTQLETVWDPWTIRNLGKVGVTEGWSCLEIAGGGGSIADWLCRRVGHLGHVIATDLQPHFLSTINAPNLEVRRHDILSDPLPQKAFDLVHARALLTFLPQPRMAVAKMVAALKPGGWLVVEEPDYISAVPDPSMTPAAAALSIKGWNALLTHLRSRGYDTEFGRHLYNDVAIHGLVDIQAEGWVAMQLGGMPSATFWKITIEQVQEQVLAAGLLSAEELKDYRTLLCSPQYRWMSLTMMSAWGRRTAQS
ncbi:MAG: class I SAM-dependent methyltransferase [Steroidobacteraceae bacterium]